MLKHLFPPHADNAYHGHKLALWLFALLVLYGHGAFAATGINPGTLAEFQVEIPRELRLVAGRGQLSPIKHAHVAVAAPARFNVRSPPRPSWRNGKTKSVSA